MFVCERACVCVRTYMYACMLTLNIMRFTGNAQFANIHYLFSACLLSV